MCSRPFSAVKEAAPPDRCSNCWTISPASDRSAVPQAEETESFHLIFGRPYVLTGLYSAASVASGAALPSRSLAGEDHKERQCADPSLECIGARASW